MKTVRVEGVLRLVEFLVALRFLAGDFTGNAKSW